MKDSSIGIKSLIYSTRLIVTQKLQIVHPDRARLQHRFAFVPKIHLSLCIMLNIEYAKFKI